MADEDSEKHAPKPAGAPSRRDGRPDPGMIEGAAIRDAEAAPEPAPEAAEAEPAAEAVEPPEPAGREEPASEPPPPAARPARGPSRFGAFVSGAAGGAVVAALVAAGGYSVLSPLFKTEAPKEELAEANAKRIAALESGVEREKSALGALEKRLGAVEAAMSAPKPATPQAPQLTGEVRDLSIEVSSLTSRLTKLERAPAPPSSAPEISALSSRVDKVEQAVAAAKAEARSSSGEDKSAGVAVVAEALREKLASGAAFPRELAALQSLGVDPAKLAPLKAAVDGGPSGPALSETFAALAPQVLAVINKPEPGMSVTDRFLAHLRGLVVVRDLGEKAGDDPEALVSQIEGLSRRGDLAGALAAFDKLPAPARQIAAGWQAQAEKAEAAGAALRSIREDAIGRLGAGKAQ